MIYRVHTARTNAGKIGKVLGYISCCATMTTDALCAGLKRSKLIPNELTSRQLYFNPILLNTSNQYDVSTYAYDVILNGQKSILYISPVKKQEQKPSQILNQWYIDPIKILTTSNISTTSITGTNITWVDYPGTIGRYGQ